MAVQINLINNSKTKVPINFSRKIAELFFEYLRSMGIVSKVVSYTFSIVYVDESAILNYNKKYRNKDISTDVLSFCTYEQGSPVLSDIQSAREISDLGDILISIDNVVRNSISRNINQEEELARVIVHGILHLLGFDHKEVIDVKDQIYRIQEGFIDTIKKRNVLNESNNRSR